MDFFVVNATTFMGSGHGEAENVLIASKSALRECMKIKGYQSQDKFIELEL